MDLSPTTASQTASLRLNLPLKVPLPQAKQTSPTHPQSNVIFSRPEKKCNFKKIPRITFPPIWWWYTQSTVRAHKIYEVSGVCLTQSPTESPTTASQTNKPDSSTKQRHFFPARKKSASLKKSRGLLSRLHTQVSIKWFGGWVTWYGKAQLEPWHSCKMIRTIHIIVYSSTYLKFPHYWK